VNELVQLGIAPKEAAFDAGFGVVATAAALAPLQTTLFITASPKNPTSVHTRRRLARYRVGCEGRISHLKREYSAGRPRLKGKRGAQIWQGWAILAYDLDTVANLPRG
jgi:IS5 family transposase